MIKIYIYIYQNQLNFAALRCSRNGPLVDEAGLQARG